MSLKRVQPGETMAYPAADFNSIISAAEAMQAAGFATGSGKRGAGSGEFDGTVIVKNSSASDRKRFEVLTITGIIISPTQNLPEFQRAPAFTCDTPTTATADKLVILLEPIKAGKLGLAMLAGRTAVQVDMVASTDAFAAPIDGDATKLRSGASGPARILYAATGTGTQWAAVLLPAGGGGDVGKWFRITAVIGTSAPFTYSATEVVSGTWTDGSLQLTGKLKSVPESTMDWVGHLAVGDRVSAKLGADGNWWTESYAYNGTYGASG